MAYATRLGLFHTQEELDLYRNRMVDGPYRTDHDLPGTWDRNGGAAITNRPWSPGLFDDIVTNANRFKAEPNKYSYDDYYKGADPWTKTANNATTYDPQREGTGFHISCASFLYLLYKEGPHVDTVKAEQYVTPVIQILKDTYKGQGYASFGSPARPAFDWTDTSRFPSKGASFGEVNPGFAICEWMCFLMDAFEYCQDHPSWTNGDKLDFKTWIRNGALMALHCNEVDGDPWGLNELFVDRANRNYTSRPGSIATAQAVIDEPNNLIYYGGPRHRKTERYYGNKRATMYGFIGLAGIFCNDDYLIGKAKRFFEEMFMFGIYPDGYHTDGHRGMVESASDDPMTAFGYAILGTMFNFCEALARKGDRGGLVGGKMTFGYDYSTIDGSVTQAAFDAGRKFPISGSGTGLNDPRDCTGMGGAKGPKMLAEYLCKRATYQAPFYYLSYTPTTDFRYMYKYRPIINGVAATNHPCYDCQWVMMAKYWGGMNASPTTEGLLMKRTARREYGTIHSGATKPSVPGSIPWSQNPDPSGKLENAWGGSHNVGALFLFDHNINPYPFSIGDAGTDGTTTQSIAYPALPTGYTYGDASFNLGATASSGLPVTYKQAGTGAVSIDSSGNVTATRAGTVTITAQQSGGTSAGVPYSAAPDFPRTFTIAQKDLTVKIQDVPTGRIYNRDNTTVNFSAVYVGFKTGEGTTALDVIPNFHCPSALVTSLPGSGTNTVPGGTFTAVGGYAAGKFPIVVNTAGVSANYNFLYTYGQLTINKGIIVFNITSDLNKTTASPDFTPTITVRETGTTTDVTGITLNWSRDSGTSVASVNLTSGLIHLSGTVGDSIIRVVSLTDPRYFIYNSYVQTVHVTSAAETPQTLVFNAPSDRTYGDGSGTFVYTPGPGSSPVTFESSDTSIVSLSGTNNVNYTILKAGDVTITAKQAAGGGYAKANDVPRGFHINRKTLTITPSTLSRAYNTENPAFTYLVTGGYVGADTIAVITTPPTLTTPAVKTSPVADYDVYAYGADALNYTFTYAVGVLHVTKANESIVGFTTLPNKYRNDPPFLLPGSATSGLALSYVLNYGPTGLTLSAGLVTIGTGLGEVSVTARQLGNGNYNAATPITTTFNIIEPILRPQTFTPTIGSVFVYGDPAFSVKVNSDSGLPVSLAIVDNDVKGVLASGISPTTCGITGAGTISIRATQAGNAEWLPASAVYVVTINKRSQVLSVPTVADKLVTSPDFSLVAAVDSGQPLTFYSNNSILSQPAPTANLFHVVTTGGASVSVRQVGSANYNPVEITRVFNILPAGSSQDNVLLQPGVRSKRGHRTVEGRTQYFWRFTGVPPCNSVRYALKYKKFNVPLHFMVTKDDDLINPVIQEDAWTQEICDVTLPTPRAISNGIVEWTSTGTSSDVNNLLTFEVYGTLT